jgi:ubiquinone/menaquinone biosynthesis C-methylase UbiE
MAKMSPVEKWIVNHASPLLSQVALVPFLRHHLALPEPAVLLELGCGAGRTALAVHRLYRPAHFVVTDYDPSEVTLANAAFQKAYHEIPAGVVFETADAVRLPYPDACFDAVLAFFVLHHLEDEMLKGLAEIDRVLKPDGQFVYAEIARRGLIKESLVNRDHSISYQQQMLASIDQVITRKHTHSQAA